MANWLFLRSQADRLVEGDAFRNAFEGADTTDAMAREVIQNSVDAALPGRVPVVRFTMLNDVDCSDVLEAEYLTHARCSRPPKIPDPRHLRYLCVEDFETTGLTGTMSDLESNMYKLMGQLGGSKKAEGMGGSFGFGKSACINCSACHTILAYTITETGSALVGTTYLDGHKLADGTSYTGIGWFCRDGSDGSQPLEVIDEEADEIAAALRIPRAESEEQGTSLLILEPYSGIEELKRAVELNWWPRLEDGRLVVELVSKDERLVPVPRTDKNLRRLIHLYDIIRKRSTTEAGQILAELSTHRQRLGAMAMEFVEDELEQEDELAATIGSIALIRDLGMVVSYYRWSQGPRRDLMGVFLADRTINGDLRMTEDLQHHVWSDKASRASEEQRDLAATVLRKIRERYNQFRRSYEPPPSQDDASLRELRHYFGSLVGAKGVSGGGNKAFPIEITDRKVDLKVRGTELQLIGSAVFRWKGAVKSRMKFGADVVLAESDISTSGDSLAVSVSCDGERHTGERPSFVRDVEPGACFMLEFESDPYDDEWTATARFFAEEVKPHED